MTPMSGPLIALTGATGFIGRHLLRELPKRGYRIRVLVRRPTALPSEATSAVIGDLAAPQNLSAALRGADAVIHSAGLAHGMSGRPEDDYRSINTEATTVLARAAEKAGAKRFIFLSSIRAQTGPTAEAVLTEMDEPRPTDAYGRSKLAAEESLARLGLDWVALRPTLVYGPGVKGNMGALLELARLPLPLPLGAFKNLRSLTGLDNLTEAVDVVLRAPGRLRRPLIVADPEPITVADMVGASRRGLGRPPGIFPMPLPVLAGAARLIGKEEAFARLAGTLVVDPTALMSLGWLPPVPTREGLAALARRASPGST
jgi:nucleoside-diphosphate-sugar epimerase